VDHSGPSPVAQLAGGILAPRDQGLAAPWCELMPGAKGGSQLWLDLRPDRRRRDWNGSSAPSWGAFCRELGLEPTTTPTRCTRAAHYWMGGVSTDLSAAPALPGLYAVGEVAAPECMVPIALGQQFADGMPGCLRAKLGGLTLAEPLTGQPRRVSRGGRNLNPAPRPRPMAPWMRDNAASRAQKSRRLRRRLLGGWRGRTFVASRAAPRPSRTCGLEKLVTGRHEALCCASWNSFDRPASGLSQPSARPPGRRSGPAADADTGDPAG